MFRLILFESLLSALTAHTPVPLDTTRAVENNVWRFDLLRDDTIAASLRVDCPSVEGFRPKGPADDPDYAIYGSRSVTIPLLQNDLTLYNYLEAEIYPAHPNTGVVNMNLRFDTTVPQTVGSHLWNLRPNRWNRVVCQLTDYDLHNVRSITLYTDLKGSSLALHDGMTYYIRNVRLQRRSKEIKTIGWEPEDDKIIYAHPGYLPSMRKRAIVSSRYVGQTFRVLDANGQEAYTGVVRQATTSIGHFGLCDFSSLSAPNHYTLSVGNLHTPLFMIGQMAYHRLTGLLLNGFFCQRCGCEVAGIHSACHADLFADHLGRSISYNGGWHDAGDLSQQTLQTADVAYALLESYIKWKNTDSLLAARLLEEARWGLKFMMKTRFGDGYRASSMGLLHWTDGIVGTQDDIHTVRKQNNAFDNFLYAAYAAYAAMVLPNEEEAKALRQAAIEDYDFAWSKYLKDGVDHFPFMMEHTYNVSYSLFMAGASWSSSMMYRLTGNTAYAARARLLMRNMLKCQEKGNSHTIGGYFYRDTTHRSIVHFIHQSREQLFAQSLVAICRTQPHAAEKSDWDNAIRLYAEYMKFCVQYTEPYEMAPSGVYQQAEYIDSVGFYRLHLFAPSDAKARYDKQLHQSVALGGGKYLRRFPIWFSIFNGNEAIILSQGKAASICANYLRDDSLRQIAQSQIAWTLGLNPFGQSLVYGEGYDYPSMDSFSSGEMMGEMPVGIRSWEDSDIPYWPMVNNACYKEVWMTSAGKLLSLLAE